MSQKTAAAVLALALACGGPARREPAGSGSQDSGSQPAPANGAPGASTHRLTVHVTGKGGLVRGGLYVPPQPRNLEEQIGAQIDCGPVCSFDFPDGARVMLVAQGGSPRFDGPCTIPVFALKPDRCELRLGADAEITVDFAAPP